MLPSCPSSSTYVTPHISRHTHPVGEPCITTYKWLFFRTSACVSFPTEGIVSCSWLRGTQGARRNTPGQVCAVAYVRGTCSGGSRSQVPTGRHFENVGPSRPLQTHVQVSRMSHGSCEVRDPECHQYRQPLRTW